MTSISDNINAITQPFVNMARERDLTEDEFLMICAAHEGPGDFWDGQPLDATGANYRGSVGMRSNGKTYWIKKYKFLMQFFCHRFHYGYIRAKPDDITAKKCEAYLIDAQPIIQDCGEIVYPGWDRYFVVARSGTFTLYGESFEPHDRAALDVMAYYFTLPYAESYKTTAYPHIKYICFDEVLSKRAADPSEFENFMSIISTIRRRREDVVIYLIGNTINRHADILNAMGINLNKLTQGEITLYRYIDPGTGGINSVAFEWQRDYEQSAESAAYAAFGHQRQLHINSSGWDISDYPLFTEDEFYNDRKIQRHAFVLEIPSARLYTYISNNAIYITRKRLKRNVEFITITTNESDYKRRVLNVKTQTGRHAINTLRQYWLMSIVKFDSNLTGDDFEYFINL